MTRRDPPLSNAERQQRYRKRQQNTKRLNLYISPAAANKLDRVREYLDCTRRQALEQLILDYPLK